METDASKYASGGVLTQKDANMVRHPCAFISKPLTPRKGRYEIYDRELLAIIRGLKEWRHYLQGGPHKVEILSDHQNLTYFRTPQQLNGRQARWLLYLSTFDFTLKHIPGKHMILSDALSRRPDHVPEHDENDKLQTLLPEELFVNLIDVELQEEISKHLVDDKLARHIIQILQQGPSQASKRSE